MPTNKEIENAERVLTRSRFMRNRYVKIVKDIGDLAVNVEKGEADKVELEVRVDSFNETVTQFRKEEDNIVHSLVILGNVNEFDELDAPVSTVMDIVYFKTRQIISRIFAQKSDLPQTSNSLPKIELPRFDGNVIKWRSFRDTYLSLVHDNSILTDIQRFHYLLTCVTNSALTIIKSIPLSAANYKLAWGALLERYDDQRLLATAHVEKLFTFKPIVQESLPALLSFINVFQENIAAIKELGVEDLAGFLLFHICSKALDQTTRRLFETSLPSNQLPNFDLLLGFVQQRCKILENIQGPVKAERAEKHIGKGKFMSMPRSFVATSTTAEKERSCVFCKNAHSIYRCASFQNQNVELRRDFAQNNKLCFSCLSSTHFANKCSSKSTCHMCKGRHHTLLHIQRDSNKSSSTLEPNEIANSTSPTMFSGAVRNNSTVVLGTAVVHILDHLGNFQEVRVLLDSGSQISAMTTECASRLNLSIRKRHSEIFGLAQNPISKVRGTTSCILFPHYSTEPSFRCEDVFVLSNITANMPAAHLPSSIRNQYQHLKLADPTFDVPSRIDMLIGGDIFPFIVRPRSEILHNDGIPSALNTYLGWIIFGPIFQPCLRSSTALTMTTTSDLDEMLRKFWTVEEPQPPEHSTTENQLCEDWFRQTTSWDSSGKLCVALPFRANVMGQGDNRDSKASSKSSDALNMYGLGNSRDLALKRLFNLERRLAKEPKLYECYRKFMNEYLDLGHMKIATRPGKYFVPHHAVLRQDGDLSKLRVVFDASASSSTGVSLNDILCTGPKLQSDIRDILLKCRLKKFLFTADIEKMYRQILIREEDCAYQHILWRNSPSDEVQEFQLLTVTYGVSSAPYLAIRCLHELDAKYGDKFPLAKGILTESTYVDDIVVGANTEVELIGKQDHIIAMLNAGGCRLKKWTSNSKLILQRVPPEDRAQLLSFDPRDESTVKVLGLHWDTRTDNFGYHTNIKQTSNSKRGVLSTIARLFDPIGTLGPTLIWAKGLMQELWQDKLQWDQPLPQRLSSSWEQFVSELSALHFIALPRHIDTQNPTDIQLLGFSDASLKGYAATAYLRIILQDGSINVHLLATKTKVAPLKTIQLDNSISVPRLELCAAYLLAQLLNHIYSVLQTDIVINKIRAWTDSSVVLSWLTAEQKDFKIFVTNRVAKIHELIPECQWMHVSTVNNPADPSSRGLLPKDLISCTIHWNGPIFLALPEAEWPQSDFTTLTLDVLPEVKSVSKQVLTVSKFPDPEETIQRFSSLNKMLRSLAYCFRFVTHMRKNLLNTGIITQLELNNALTFVIKLTQQKFFKQLYQQLENKNISVSPPSIAQLMPFIDSDGLVRVGGRLRFSALNDDAKHPILIPKFSHFTSLLIRHYHLSFLHGGPGLILSMMNRKYWILSGRDAVRQFIYSCVPCSRHRAVHPKPIMADLPAFRVQQHRPFLHTGMDYGGPFTVKESRQRNAKTSKAYLALFICMSTKAVHLEIVSELTTAAFLAALDRFVARRGIPSNLYSDCGTNYVGAARQIKALFSDLSNQNSVSKHLHCNWHFNPPATPHFGGIWEAAIKSVKTHLKHVIGIQVLTFEELNTVTARIEGILNSRPLTPLSSDPHDLCALTPGHFLIGQPIYTIPEDDVTNVPMNRLNRWQLIRQCHQSFWKRWTREYLTTLQGRMKWFQPSTNLAVNDLVIVEAPNRPPTDWCLGRILAIHPGTDGVVRVVTVRTQDGVYKRPSVKLVKLPISD